MIKRTGLPLLVLLLVACGQTAPAHRQKIDLLSWNHGFMNEVGRPAFGKLQAVEGSLIFPKDAGNRARLPAVVMLHSGVGQAAQDWFYAKLLNEWGIVVFAIDSFKPRGVENTVGNQAAVSEASILADAFAALNYLSAHPRIDPARIAAVGFSKGATPTILAGLERYRVRMADGDNRFAAHIGYYPWCGFNFMDRRTTGSPILVMSGAEDSVTPAPLCEELTRRWAISNPDTDIEMVVYQDAGHAFEYPHPMLEMLGGLPVLGELPTECFFAEVERDVFLELHSKVLVDASTVRLALNVCAEYTARASVLHNKDAQADSRQRLRALLERTLLTPDRQEATVGASE